MNKALEGKTGVLLECPVERSEYKGNPEYPVRSAAASRPPAPAPRGPTCPDYRSRPSPPFATQYRTHRQLKLTGVPTLYRWGRRGPVGKLVEEDLVDAEKVAELVA